MANEVKIAAGITRSNSTRQVSEWRAMEHPGDEDIEAVCVRGARAHCARRHDPLTSPTVHRGPRPLGLHRRFERPRARSLCAVLALLAQGAVTRGNIDLVGATMRIGALRWPSRDFCFGYPIPKVYGGYEIVSNLAQLGLAGARSQMTGH
jgi:hypothetical protein